jgi:Outer membrane protein beta-barrel domain
MKKILFSVIALAAFGAMSAQEETTTQEGYSKGDTFITGQVGFSTQKNDNSRTTQFSIGPSVGYFVTNHIALGAGFVYGHQWNKDPQYWNNDLQYTIKTTQNTYAPSVFGRYYFTPANKFSLFAHVGASYYYHEYRLGDDAVNHSNTFTALAGGGFNYFITQHLSLNTTLALVQYTDNQYNSSNYDKTSVLSAELNLSNLQFGMSYKF